MTVHNQLDVSIVIVSFNTCDLLRECLQTVLKEAGAVSYEIIVVDNASLDGSAEMVAREFPQALLVRSEINLGFAAANNQAFDIARGKYVVLLNSDALLHPRSLARAVAHMELHPWIGLGGGRLVGRDGAWQPSARMFPSLVSDFLCLSGLSVKFSKSRFFGRADSTWADEHKAAEVDWVPGAFSIIRRKVLEEEGYFDESFFLYYEEVDLCRRIKAAGYSVWYWPDVVIVHLGGESSKTIPHLSLSASGTQLTLWRMRSALIYYRKHHGWRTAWLAKQVETLWHLLRAKKNTLRPAPENEVKAGHSAQVIALMKQAWNDTKGGLISPPHPW